MSIFRNVDFVVPSEGRALNRVYAHDRLAKKVNLCIGAYRDEKGNPWVLPVVRETEKDLFRDEALNIDNLPVLGMEEFCIAATSMLLGRDCKPLLENRACGIQCISGSNALRIGAEFLVRALGSTIFYYSKPTWRDHCVIFQNAGFEEGRTYRYWSESKRALDMVGLLTDLNNAPEGSVVILQACAHNPTGCDPTKEQWEEIAKVIEAKKLFPFFDSSYQGVASGDLDEDAWAVRYFVSKGFELFCAQSFSKNFGLYSEGVGNLTIVLNGTSLIPEVHSQFSLIIRAMYLNPPAYGARIVAYILNNLHLYEQWKSELQIMSSRIVKMREALYYALEELGTPGNWNHILTQVGMYTCTGLNNHQSQHMIKKHHIYMLRSGKINLCGVTPSNVEAVAAAIHETITNVY